MKKLVALFIAITMLLGAFSALAEVTDPIITGVGQYPLVKEEATLTIMLPDNADILSWDDNYATNFFEEKTGVNIEFMPISEADYATKVDLLINSGDSLPDIILGVSSSKMHTYAQTGGILALDEYYDKENGIAASYWARCEELGLDGEYLLNQVRDTDGHIYGMINRVANISDIYSYRGWINQTWLTNLGLEMPKTSEDLYNVLCAFRDNDPNGNGEKDEIPMLGATGQWRGNVLNYLLDMFVYFDGEDDKRGYLPLNETDGKLDVYYDKPEYQQALIYMNKLVSEGLIGMTSFSDDGTTLKALVKTGTDVGLFIRGGASASANYNSDYVALEPLSGPEGKQYATAAYPAASITALISVDCEHPELAFLFLEIFNNAEYPNYLTARFGEEGKDWDLAPEGTPSMYYEIGYNANIVDYVNNWSTQNDKIWRTDSLPFLWSDKTMMVGFDGNDGDSERMNALGSMLCMKYAPAEKDVITVLNYNDEELEEWSDARTALTSYVEEARAMFAVGDMDPVNDWDAYLEQLNKYQYKDIIAVDQIVYDRMYNAD